MNGAQNISSSPSITSPGRGLPGQIVLVPQGGGALGAFQAGVYQALHEAGIEPDWVIGTSIGAINASLIAGNQPQDRLAACRNSGNALNRIRPGIFVGHFRASTRNYASGRRSRTASPASSGPIRSLTPAIPMCLTPRTPVIIRPRRCSGRLRSLSTSIWSTAASRLTVGAAHVRTSQMRYFDSRDCALSVSQVLASGALPPAFPGGTH